MRCSYHEAGITTHTVARHNQTPLQPLSNSNGYSSYLYVQRIVNGNDKTLDMSQPEVDDIAPFPLSSNNGLCSVSSSFIYLKNRGDNCRPDCSDSFFFLPQRSAGWKYARMNVSDGKFRDSRDHCTHHRPSFPSTTARRKNSGGGHDSSDGASVYM